MSRCRRRSAEPGESTHELRNDGKAYSGHARDKLKWWQCGIDVNDSDVQRFIAAAKKRGWVVSQTYPLSKTEFHHVNFRKPPVRERVRGHVGGALRRGHRVKAGRAGSPSP